MNKYLNFIEMPPKAKTKVYNIHNSNNEYLGEIRWKPQWRKYCYFINILSFTTIKDFPNSIDLLVFDSNCLNEIVNFMEKLNVEHRQHSG